jgi:hypothetical protein
VHEGNDVGQTGIHADEPLMPERNFSEIYIVTEYFKKLYITRY